MIFKKIKIRESTYDRLDEAFVQPVAELISGFTDDMKQKLQDGAGSATIDWNEPEGYFKQGVSNARWSDAFNSSSGHNTDNLVKLFIQCRMIPDIVSERQLDEWGDLLIGIIRQLGFTSADNPFIGFLQYMRKEAKVDLTRDDVILVNNLWADGVIDGSTISGKGPDKREHIIFNPALYSSTENVSDDRYNIVKSYDRLSDLYVVRQLNLDAIVNVMPKSSAQRAALRQLTAGSSAEKHSSHYTGTNYRDVRDLIIYKSPDKHTINQYYNIKKWLDAGSTSADDNSSGRSASRHTVDDYAADLKKNLSGKDVLALMQRLVKDGTISLSDLK